jgi:hypothetical protein
MSFEEPGEEDVEDWAENLYPEEIADRLRAGIARYAQSERSRSAH